MICVVDAFALHLFPANIRAVIPASGNHRTLRAVGQDHIDLLWGRPFRNKYFAMNACFGGIGGDAVPGIAAAVLNHRINTDLLAVRHQYGGAPVFVGERRHKIIHFQQNIFVQPYDRGHAFSQRNRFPFIADRHEFPIAEHAPFIPVNLIQ